MFPEMTHKLKYINSGKGVNVVPVRIYEISKFNWNFHETSHASWVVPTLPLL